MKTKIGIIILVTIGSISNLFAQTENTYHINEWLQLGRFTVNLPAFHSTENMKQKAFENSDLLSFDFLEVAKLEPSEGDILIRNSEELKWNKVNTAKNGSLIIDRKPDATKFEMAYLATYIETDRWLKINLKVESPNSFEVYVNGKSIAAKKTDDKPDAGETGYKNEEIKLERGKHILVVKSMKTPEKMANWQLSASFTVSENFLPALVSTGITPESKKEIRHLMNGRVVNNATISPDGELIMLSVSEVAPPDGTRTNWHEFRETATGKLVHSVRGSNMRSLKWMPSGRTLTYIFTAGKTNSIRTLDFLTMEEREISGSIDELSSYRWAPDGSFLIYSVSEKHDEQNELVKRFENMADRWPWWRNRSFLYRIDAASGAKERLTYGHISTSLEDISFDNKKILFTQSFPDFEQRPYSRQILFEMDMQTFAVDTILNNHYGGSFLYAPDGEHLLVTGSPALFGNIGTNTTGDAIPNDYDTQAYLYNMATGDVNPITFNFNPSVIEVKWSNFNPNIIHILATDRTFKHLFNYNFNTQYFEKIDTGIDVINQFSIADEQPYIVCTGSGISAPKYVSLINFETGTSSTFANPEKETYNNVVFGRTEDWNFTNRNGATIEGSVYYPPNFDPEKKYPLIVYYYGGTSPSDRSFGGRYPKNLFAAQDYVVYNVQPSGAIGWGQDFSAAHVNNWGITVADEIIDGTKLFLEQHTFIDENKVGCIGASYGGFMTMLLQTRTDIFAAAISHAGISAISSYWGEGYWGYLYSSAASANSFPWNNQRLYIDQSALYNADKINTPLLLLHGDSDTNVPPGESIQLFTALKLLGRPVELIEIKGQDHHILDYKKRILWQKTILAWFDKWLKNQPEWWQELYPERNL